MATKVGPHRTKEHISHLSNNYAKKNLKSLLFSNTRQAECMYYASNVNQAWWMYAHRQLSNKESKNCLKESNYKKYSPTAIKITIIKNGVHARQESIWGWQGEEKKGRKPWTIRVIVILDYWKQKELKIVVSKKENKWYPNFFKLGVETESNCSAHEKQEIYLFGTVATADLHMVTLGQDKLKRLWGQENHILDR